MTRFILKVCALVVFLSAVNMPASAMAQGTGGEASPMFGLGGVYGNSFGPRDDIRFLMVNSFIRFDQDKICTVPGLESLKWKIEGNFGSLVEPKDKFIGGLGLTAQYYFTGLATSTFKPYLEANLSAIFIDFRVDRQGQRWNFNPQAGIGTDVQLGSVPCFVALRWFHISNAGLREENVGIDSMVLMFGRYF